MAEILIVEDAEAIAELLSDHLRDAGHEVAWASDGQAAMEHLLAHSPDLVVLDVMLPVHSGVEVCRWLRARNVSQPVVLMLTARREERDALDGYDAGADDYVRKPFSVKELVRRVQALLTLALHRRAPVQPESDPTLRVIVAMGALEVDPAARKAQVAGQGLDLAPMEFDLLLRMLRSVGEVLDRETLLRDVWGYQHSGYARTVDSHVTRLRRKLAATGHEGMIRTVHGVGYCLEKQA